MSRFFDVFQLVAVACFVCLFAWRAVALHRRGVTVFVVGQGNTWLERYQNVIAFGCVMLYVYEVVAFAAPLPFHFTPAPLDRVLLDSVVAQGVGAAMIAPGLALFAWALVSFGASWRVGIDERTPGELITTGAFAVSRNPIYVFFDVYAVGTFLLTGRLVFLLCVPIAVLGVHRQVREEEAFLQRRYGDAFRDYCARVPRYLVW